MKKVLFLCIGNSCRSQMAEGFARKYGADVMEPMSAGLAPAAIVQPLTRKVMEAKNIRLEAQFPKDLAAIDTSGLDLIVNMSGTRIPGRLAAELRDWDVDDPIGAKEDVYVAVRDRIEMLVMHLILELRRGSRRRA
ncbi:MAG: arsenate reductase ArsC [Terriglobia bacterium]